MRIVNKTTRDASRSVPPATMVSSSILSTTAAECVEQTPRQIAIASQTFTVSSASAQPTGTRTTASLSTMVEGPTVVVRAVGGPIVTVPFDAEREGTRVRNLVANGLLSVQPRRTDGTR
jgi:hypothetical protein